MGERDPGPLDDRAIFPGEDETGQAPEQFDARVAIGADRRQQPAERQPVAVSTNTLGGDEQEMLIVPEQHAARGEEPRQFQPHQPFAGPLRPPH